MADVSTSSELIHRMIKIIREKVPVDESVSQKAVEAVSTYAKEVMPIVAQLSWQEQAQVAEAMLYYALLMIGASSNVNHAEIARIMMLNIEARMKITGIPLLESQPWRT